MSDPYFYAESEHGFGRVFVLCGDWDPRFGRLIAADGIRAFRVASGWRGTDVEFLRGMTDLVAVEIYGHDVRDASVLEALPSLKMVALDCDLRVPVDFDALPDVEIVLATYRREIESVLRLEGIRYLNLSRWPFRDLRRLSSMTGLETLFLESRKLESLSGIETMSALEHLDLHDCRRLASLSGVEDCAQLRVVSLSVCKGVEDLSFVESLRALRVPRVDGCSTIASLEPLRGCDGLQTLTLLGDTTIVDGRTSVLEELGGLETLQMTPRRSYDRTRVEILARIDQRSS